MANLIPWGRGHRSPIGRRRRVWHRFCDYEAVPRRLMAKTEELWHNGETEWRSTTIWNPKWQSP
jgi:hypothetical protein